MAELLSLSLAIGPLQIHGVVRWGSEPDEAQPMLIAPPGLIDVPEEVEDDDDLADDRLGFRTCFKGD